jgi:putative hemolysin
MLSSILVKPTPSEIKIQIKFGKFEIKLAETLEELHALLKLRHQIFYGQETPNNPTNSLDIDDFDFDSDHLALWDTEANRIVGTYRLRHSQKISAYYSATEFDCLDLFESLTGPLIELGRACIHPDYRNGVAASLLWSGLGSYIKQTQAKWVFGCSSISFSENQFTLRQLCAWLLQNHQSSLSQNIRPWNPHPDFLKLEELDLQGENMARFSPPLLKAYLRIGAQICGAPAWDQELNTLDFLTILEIDKIPERTAQQFGIK